jgi:hypothetical protein
MKNEEIKVRDRIGMGGLKNKGLIEISQDTTAVERRIEQLL